ncbi:LuxR C-terminal-related transcriptional regulator [Nocardioides sp. MAHUQ-72]|uniref:helix-turn-helix transcriptional regulator n=1 Tax=unclassified Nocardioides TaxID=2615069 RepID=UPI003611A6D4
MQGTDHAELALGDLAPALLRGCLLVRAGRTTEALAALEAFREDADPAPRSVERAVLLAAVMDCRLARGDLGEALAIGDELAEYDDVTGRTTGPVAGLAYAARGELSAALSETELAAAHFERAGRLLEQHDLDPGLVPWRTGAALAAVRLGRRAEATRLAREHLDLVLPSGSPYVVAQALRTLAATDAGADSLALLRRARAALDGLPTGRLAVQIDTDLAGLLLLSPGEQASAEALALLRSAEEYAGHQELWPLQGRVRRLLERMGEAPRRVRAEVLATLTASEHRVARLAADGLTNRAIAQRLEVTVKAVEWHLSHVYRKLEIPSRAGLAATLGARG